MLGIQFFTAESMASIVGIAGAVNIMKINYDLSRRWSVQARAGSENAVDLFYTLGFR